MAQQCTIQNTDNHWAARQQRHHRHPASQPNLQPREAWIEMWILRFTIDKYLCRNTRRKTKRVQPLHNLYTKNSHGWKYSNRTIWFIWKEQHRTAVDPCRSHIFLLAKSPFSWVLLPWFSWGSAGAALFSAAHGERLRLAAAVWSLFSPSHYWRFICSSSRYGIYMYLPSGITVCHGKSPFFRVNDRTKLLIFTKCCPAMSMTGRDLIHPIESLEGASSLMKPPAMVATFSRPTSRRHLVSWVHFFPQKRGPCSWNMMYMWWNRHDESCLHAPPTQTTYMYMRHNTIYIYYIHIACSNPTSLHVNLHSSQSTASGLFSNWGLSLGSKQAKTYQHTHIYIYTSKIFNIWEKSMTIDLQYVISYYNVINYIL